MIAGLWALAWTAANTWWLARDRVLRDGDEEGHVGAAELFRGDLLSGEPLAFLARLWAGEMGDYPSLHPALIGGWWWLTGVGEPGVPLVRGLGLAWVLLAALAAARIAARGGHAGAPLLAFVATTLLPLPVALGRHFMPEGLLVATSALAVLAALRLAERPTAGRGAALGLALGLGLLTKQTFLLVGLPGVLAALWLGGPRGGGLARAARGLLVAVGVAALVAGPWSARHLARQLAYGAESVAHSGEGTLSAHLAFYPVALALLVVGPPLLLLALPALPQLRRRGPAALAATWLVVGLLALGLLPKKYPRLAAPLAPAVAVLVGVGLAGPRRAWAGGAALLLAGGGWLAWRSLTPPLDLPRPLQRVVPGCPQHWLGAPTDDDLGMGAVADLLRQAGPGPVRVPDGPEISCSLQTTAPWAEHLGPYLRRTGQDREVLLGEGDEPVSWVLTWEADGLPPGGEGGQTLSVPRLHGRFRLLRGTLAPR
ncbi:glycosyltransferase family 39 protein [Myxococcota bacterium]|nr:glycosyltransferase family 39 protein [Myxococcota bacterium]